MKGRIDSHQHFWRLARGDYGWLKPELSPIYRDFLPADLEPHLARCEVDSTLLVQAAPTVAETEYLLQLARQHEFIAGVVGWVDFEQPDAPEQIARLAGDERLLGLRPMIQDIPDPQWMLRPGLAAAIEAMQAHGLVFDALVLPRHLQALCEFAARYPGLQIVVDHAAKPPLRGGDLGAWKAGISQVAASSAAVCKLSGLVTEAVSADPALLAPVVDHVLECFGPRRLMWGSDWPVCELVCSFEQWDHASAQLLAGLTGEERQRLYSDTARETYGI